MLAFLLVELYHKYIYKEPSTLSAKLIKFSIIFVYI